MEKIKVFKDDTNCESPSNIALSIMSELADAGAIKFNYKRVGGKWKYDIDMTVFVDEENRDKVEKHIEENH